MFKVELRRAIYSVKNEFLQFSRVIDMPVAPIVDMGILDAHRDYNSDGTLLEGSFQTINEVSWDVRRNLFVAELYNDHETYEMNRNANEGEEGTAAYLISKAYAEWTLIERNNDQILPSDPANQS